MNLFIFHVTAVLVALWGARAAAKDVAVNYKDGKPHFRYQVDSKNQKVGTFEEFAPDGKIRVRGTYLADKKTGSWIVYGDNGKSLESLTYRNDQLEGPYRYNFPSGQPEEVTTYHEDDFAGPITVNDEKGRLLRTITYPRRYDAVEQAWDAFYPKSRDNVKFTDQPSLKPPYDPGRISVEDQQAGLKYTMLYRFLSGLSFDKMTVENNLIDRAQHGAVLLAKDDMLTHQPDQPRDMDDGFYKVAYAGCNESNLFQGRENLFDAIDWFMDDSDDTNIKQLDHRCWLLSPGLQRTGFGCCGDYILQHVVNTTRTFFTFCAYPGPGYYPIKLLHKDAAWSIHFANDKVRFPALDKLAVHVTALDEHFAGSQTIAAEIVNTLEDDRFRVIIFRPKLKSLEAARYYVEVLGLRGASGGSIPFSYLVDLQEMPDTDAKSTAATKPVTKK